jgi:hypothetical protein
MFYDIVIRSTFSSSLLNTAILFDDSRYYVSKLPNIQKNTSMHESLLALAYDSECIVSYVPSNKNSYTIILLSCQLHTVYREMTLRVVL